MLRSHKRSNHADKRTRCRVHLLSLYFQEEQEEDRRVTFEAKGLVVVDRVTVAEKRDISHAIVLTE